MNNIRVKFLRGEEVKFISHLDLLKVFERALRRSHILVSHSQGFNPRPHMVFGLPLSVGVTSIAEYADFELNEVIEPQEFVERLNKELPDGLKIIEAKEKQSKVNIMASISQASYEILVLMETNSDIDTVNKKITEFMNEPSAIVKKETKNGIKDVNVKPLIFSIEVKFIENYSGFKKEDNGYKRDNDSLEKNISEHICKPNEEIFDHKYNKNFYYISAVLSAGSASNLKPELLINALDNLTGLGIRIAKIKRTGLFVEYEGKYLNPLEAGVLLGS